MTKRQLLKRGKMSNKILKKKEEAEVGSTNVYYIDGGRKMC